MKKNNKSQLVYVSKLLKYGKKYTGVVLLSFLCAFISMALTLIGPNKLSELTDEITKGITNKINMQVVVNLGVTSIIIYICSYVMSVLQGWIMASVSRQLSKNLRTDISRKLNRLPMWYYNQTSIGNILSILTNDVGTIGDSINQSIVYLLPSEVLFIGSLWMMFQTNFVLTIASASASFLGFILICCVSKYNQKYFSQQQENLAKMNSRVEEIYNAHILVKAYGGELYEQKKFETLNQSLRESGFKTQIVSGILTAIIQFIDNLSYITVCIVGTILVIEGEISFGVIVSFIFYVRYLTQPLTQLTETIRSFQLIIASSRRVFELLDAEEMEDEHKKKRKIIITNGNIEFSHVKFGYEKSNRIVIKDFSLKVKPGQKIAIVGPTGAGKTTLVSLLMRFHDILKGDIKIDGVSIKDMSREEVHDQFCMVLQDTWLFTGTIRENLIYVSKNADEKVMQQACISVGIDNFIKKLPNGYDTLISEKINLSQGQRQQLAIARAIIANKPMLILDEATSSVDTRTECLIQKAMDLLMENRTSFVIAHRLSTVKNADMILVIKDGEIVESGSHHRLIEKNGFYAKLYNSQFKNSSKKI